MSTSTQKSSLQLQNLIQRLRDDEQAAECPEKDFRLPQSLIVPVAFLYLEDQPHLKAASDLLRSLNITRMLRQAGIDASAANVSDHCETGTKAPIAEDDHGERVPPLSVSLIGLSQGPRTHPERPISTAPVDSTNRLHFLSRQISNRFQSAGLGEVRLGSDQGIVDTGRAEILSIRRARKLVILTDESGYRTFERLKSIYTARGLIEKYKDVTLAQNIPLEKLSLCNYHPISNFIGLSDEFFVDDPYEELDSIPLPQEA